MPSKILRILCLTGTLAMILVIVPAVSTDAQVRSVVTPNLSPQYLLGKQLIPDGDTAALLPGQALNPGSTNCVNSDFSEGTFSNWSGCFGTFDDPCQNTGFNPTRHVIMPRTNQTYDPFIGSPLTTVFPGEEHSARLGDTLEGGHSEELRYTVNLTPDNLLFIYRWASVLESVGHEMWQMPKFALQVEDMAGNAIGGPCGFYEFIAPNCSPPGPSCIVPPEWHYFAVPSPSIDLYWHDWTTIALDLTPFESLGQIQIVFTTRGCALQIHRGYAYLSTYCSPLDIQISMCTGSTQAILTAPPGFAEYAWRGPGLTGPPVGTTQSITISDPQANEKYYVNLTAANGCVVNDLSQEILATVVDADFTWVPHCAGEATTFQDISTVNQNDIVYWHWMFGDGGPDLGGIPDPTHVYTQPGTYTVTLHPYSTEGCMGSVSHTITITAGASPTLSGPDTVCSSGPGVTYRTQPGMTSYSWTLPPGTTLVAGGTSTSDSVVVSWNNPGNYVIGVNYINPQSACSTTPASMTVTAGTLTPPVILGEDTLCMGGPPVTYSTQAGKINYAWSLPPEAHLDAGGTGTDDYATVTWLVPGSYVVGVNYTEPVSLCTPLSPATLSVWVNALPGPAGNIQGADSVCKPLMENYTVTAIGGASSCLWEYSGNGVAISGNGSPAVTLSFSSAATSGILRVRWMNQCGEGTVSPPHFIRVDDLPVVGFTPCFD
ncbi:MAG TPA: PKD domain-containing protein, partial [Bacteroidales bacterium]|nr:PKD domain-containing protein [Bacteroidales bacterium]